MKKQAAGSEKAFFSKSGTSCNIQAKAIITKDGKTGIVDIMYEEIDDLVQVYVDFDSIEWTD